MMSKIQKLAPPKRTCKLRFKAMMKRIDCFEHKEHIAKEDEQSALISYKKG
ncbi:MAG: hypothetical protein Q4B71_07475 [Cardiobacteriaceae bacterium]|nr:hypothetical protein [Cardiobacteriaceae bacterium]